MDMSSCVARWIKPLLSGTRLQWLVRGALGVLIFIIVVTLANLWSVDDKSLSATHRLSLSFTIVNPLPRDLDSGRLSIRLPSRLTASLVTSNPLWRVIQQGVEEQTLVFTPKQVNAFASEDVELELFLSPRLSAPSENVAIAPVASTTIEPLLRQPASLPESLSSLLRNCNSLAQLDTVLRKDKEQLASLSLPGELNKLSGTHRTQYLYLMAMMNKAAELKLPAHLLSGWAFDSKGLGEYVLSLEVIDGAKSTYWSLSSVAGNYQPAGLVDAARFYDDPNGVFAPFSGAGLQVKAFKKMLLEQLPEK